VNIHEHQAKDILREFEAPVPKGVVVYNIKEIDQKIKILNTNNFVIKAQIHAGGRGKAGGIKLVKTNDDLIKEATSMLGKTLITKQTGPRGKIVKRLYIEEVSKIKKEFYLSCLVDRASAKIAFISSTEGGVDIEKVAKDNPEKIITTKIDLTNEVNETNVEKIIKIFQLDQRQKIQAKKLINSIFRLLIKKDANLIEVNPLIITKDDNLLCLDAKISFDDNALYRHPDITSLKDPNEEEPIETEARKHELSYIKLNGTIGCMVNGAGLAMATLDIIKLYGAEPANFLDVGGGARQENVEKAFRIITMDPNVKCILINIFGGIVRCDMVAAGVIAAFKSVDLQIPVVVRLEGTNSEEAHILVNKSGLGERLQIADGIREAAKKAVAAAS